MNSRLHAAAVPAEAEEDGIDLAHLDRATFGDRALQIELLALFDRQANVLLAEIKNAVDLQARQAAAHTLKGAASGVGAAEVAQAAQAFEDAAGDAARLDIALARLAVEIAAARRQIADILERG